MTNSFNLFFAKTVFFLTISVLGVLATDIGISASHPKGAKLKFRNSFGNCPKKVAGSLAMTIMSEFERNHSLREVKRKIVEEKLTQKHYVSSYSIKYNPIKGIVDLKLDCPEPFMNVQFFKESGLESYNAILVESGELYDPTYEMLLKMDKKLTHKLPFLALPDPDGEINAGVKNQISSITTLIRKMEPKFRHNLSELIVNDSEELTIILSIKGKTSSVFLGSNEWNTKVMKLQKIMAYMKSEKRIPTIINLTNAKKVVVKFNDKF
jgi:hypothetical protein